jgi:hypothetical protein
VPYAFLDFEASSLSKQSYPVEVGWVTQDGAGESHLIRPAPEWTDWDESAAAVHGIARDTLLEHGETVSTVCARLIDLFAGHTVVASAPSWDGHWLSRLLRAAGKPRHLLRLQPLAEAVMEAARARLGAGAAPEAVAALVAAVESEADAEPVAHRALADARRAWAIWHRIAYG